MKQFDPEIIRQLNEKTIKESKAEFEYFTKCHSNNNCYLCGLNYDVFQEEQPCMHWLLRPMGVKKKHIKDVLIEFGCFRSRAFMRWLANTQKFAKNINDLKEEGDPSKIIQETISYNNLEWSFSCSPNDLEGHKNSNLGKEPHFHFQMRIDGKPFIDYADFHLKFTEYDLFVLDIKSGKLGNVEHVDGYAGGMQQLMDMVAHDESIKEMKRAESMKDGQFRIQTIIEAEEGTLISGDEIYRLSQESKKTGKTMSELMSQLPNIKIKRIILPADDVPLKAERTKHKKR